MSNGNTVVMNFKVSPRLKEIIEKHANSKKLSVSEYIRDAVLFDMIISGNIDAFNYLATGVGEKFHGAVRNFMEKLKKDKKGKDEEK